MANPLVISSAQKYWQLHAESPQHLPFTYSALGFVFWASRAIVVLSYKYCLIALYGADKVVEIVARRLKNLNPAETHFFHGFTSFDQYDICFLSTGELKLLQEKILGNIRVIETGAQRIALCQRIVQLFHPVIALANEEYKRNSIADISNAMYDEINSSEREPALVFDDEDDISLQTLVQRKQSSSVLWDNDLMRICRYHTKMERIEKNHPWRLTVDSRLRARG